MNPRFPIRTSLLVAAFVVAGLAGCFEKTSATPLELLGQARDALANRDYAEAEEVALRVPEKGPYRNDALMVAAEAATKAKRHSAAVDYYRQLIERETDPKKIGLARFYLAEAYRELGRLSDAQDLYQQVLEDLPENAATHERLGFLYALTGRKWHAVPHYYFLARSGSATVQEMVVLADPDRPVEHLDYLRKCAAQVPDDPLVKLGLAANAVWQGEHHKALTQLEAIIAAHPEFLAAQVMLGELLVKGSSARFWQWHDALPSAAEKHPDVWLIRGLRGRAQGNLRVAARCFWEALRRMPIHRRATNQLGQVLAALDHPAAESVNMRATELVEMTQSLDDVLRVKGRSDRPMHKVVQSLESMGRIWETCAWALLARKQFPRVRWPHVVLARRAEELDDDLPMILPEKNLAARLDLSDFPDQRQLERPEKTPEDSSPGQSRSGSIRFVMRSEEAGLDFVYNNAPDPATKGGRMQESNGGGVAVLDYDLDGRPDIYFTQGGRWDPGETRPHPTPEFHDCLYRHCGESYKKVALESGLGSQAFGQGCTAGDIDGDGFPDLRVANIGTNQLYRNNGDGTFTNISSAAGPAPFEWSSSCVIVDLNADGYPDIYDVNYLQGPKIYTMICDGFACSPKSFAGVPDRVWISNGDGTFHEFENPIPPDDSKGLGVLAAMIEDPRRPSLFIANDQVANFYVRCLPSDGPDNLQLKNRAPLNGLAYSLDGLAMACMGIAAGDADGNGLLDFYVSNFSNESNTLYLQDAPGLFLDATAAAGLRAPSWQFVGWGTQFLDAELDGDLDIVLTNGHLDDYTDRGDLYYMRPQFFRNTGGGSFEEMRGEAVGAYFDEKYLGRALARLDWNSDGRMEFVVSNIGERASLLANKSDAGNYLNLHLHAVTTAREAVGTVVKITAGGRTLTRRVTAGNGYQCRNQPLLQFGIGEATAVSEVEVTWPGGAMSRLGPVAANRTIVLTEGRHWCVANYNGNGETIAVE